MLTQLFMKKILFILAVFIPNLFSFAQSTTNNNQQPYIIVIPREQLQYSPIPSSSPAPTPTPAPPTKPAEPAKPAPRTPSTRFYYELAFKFSPTITSNYVEGTNEFLPVVEKGAAGRITLGPIVDIFFLDSRCAFSTGVWYTVKSVNFWGPNSVKTTYTETQLTQKVASSYNVQYIQVPLSLKLVSSPIMRSLNCYVNFGGIFNYKIAEKAIAKESNILYKHVVGSGNTELFNQTNLGILIGGGIYQKVNSQNSLILGFSYNRDLFNSVRDPNLISRSSIFSLDIGMVF